MASKDPSKYEYTLKDCGVTAVSKSGKRYTFSDRVGGCTYNPNGTAGVVKGSAAFPVAHTGTTYEPEFSLSIPIDENEKFQKWYAIHCAEDGVCDIERRRKKLRVAAIIDVLGDWNPIPGEESFAEGEATMVELTGSVLAPRKDITNALNP
jgi:hypothetical protein